jgi:glycosyltransferase involved in cell wall biosynthesis
MDFVNQYLTKHSFIPSIKLPPPNDLHICVVIPCYNEPNLIPTLQSLWNCERPKRSVEIIILVNEPENCSEFVKNQNLQTIKDTNEWIGKHSDTKLTYHILYKPNLPQKHAGVGLARKLGMDEALFRLYQTNNYQGIVVGFDADSECAPNYFIELENHFLNNPQIWGCSINFEHPIEGNAYSLEIYQGIILYELHLRYLNQALRFTGHPFAWHTVGSAFAVRMNIYAKQGGMNRRQAGEDFYFLQKIIEAGSFSELNSTCVYPSPRQSDRVFFGTGAAMNKWLTDNKLLTYRFESYLVLKQFFDLAEMYFNSTKESIQNSLNLQPAPLCQFLEREEALAEILKINKNVSSNDAFVKRFFRWFNAFKVIKYLNYAHEDYFKKGEVAEEAAKLLNSSAVLPAKELLIKFRQIEKDGSFELHSK